MIVFFHLVIICVEFLKKKLIEDDSHKFDHLWDLTNLTNGNCMCENGKITFYPPCYIQRYVAVSRIIENEQTLNGPMKKVVDFGCAELNYFVYLKNMKNIEEVLCVDIDKTLLTRLKVKAEPEAWNYLQKRNIPLTASVICGSVDTFDECLINTDVVVAIELIEHLYPEVLDKMPENIFGNIQPKLAIFTTPNAEFNVLFNLETEFRHYDHKFEWSRKEFSIWASNIIAKYPNYTVKLFGIGPPPPNFNHLGCCSQMAVFKRINSDCKINNKTDIKNYDLIARYDFPYTVETRTKEKQIIDQLNYHARMFKCNLNYLDEETGNRIIPLEVFLPYLTEITTSLDEVQEVMKNNGWDIICYNQSPKAVFPKTPSDSGSEDDPYETDLYYPTSGPDYDSPTLDWGYENPTTPISRKRRISDDTDCVIERKKRSQSRNNDVDEDEGNNDDDDNVTVRGLVKSFRTVHRYGKKFRKSYSLDSCLEEVNKRFSVLLSPGSCDKLDSGYPLSFDTDLTPEQVEDLGSNSSISSKENDDANNEPLVVPLEEPLPEPPFINEVGIPLIIRQQEAVERVENGDLANNNRDDEGNNVEGIAPHAPLVLDIDPNDNNFHEEVIFDDEGLGNNSDDSSSNSSESSN